MKLKLFRSVPKISCLIVLGLFALEVSAQEEKEDVGPIATDRPVQSETPNTVPKKHLQFELGYEYNEQQKGQVVGQTAPTLLIKYGIIDDLELRMTNAYLITDDRTSGTSLTTSGIDNPTFGIKYKITHSNDEGQGVDFVASISSKVDAWGDKEYEVNQTNILARLTAGTVLKGSWYAILGMEYGFYDRTDDIGFFVFQTGLSPVNGLTALIEYYGYLNTTNVSFPQVQSAVNGALVYLLADNHQVDVSAGYGLEHELYDYYIGLGYSYRLGF